LFFKTFERLIPAESSEFAFVPAWEKLITKTAGQTLVLNPELWRLYEDKILLDPSTKIW